MAGKGAMRRWWRERRGISALEFAVTVPVLLAVSFWLVDLGLLEQARDNVTLAVNAGAQYAELAGKSVTAAAIQTAGQAATTLAPLTFTANGPSYYCASTSTSGTVTLTASSAGATCADGSKAGLYVQITASYTYQPLLPLGSIFLGSTAINEQAWVRLQ